MQFALVGHIVSPSFFVFEMPKRRFITETPLELAAYDCGGFLFVPLFDPEKDRLSSAVMEVNATPMVPNIFQEGGLSHV